MARELIQTRVASYSKTFMTMFLKAYWEETPELDNLVTFTTYSGSEAELQVPGSPPAMEEWLSEVQHQRVSATPYTIKDRRWGKALDIPVSAFEDDNLGLYPASIQTFGQNARNHPGELVCQLMRDGGATTCYDGQYFFDTDHSEGSSGTLSNIITGTVGTGYTLTTFKNDWMSAWDRMQTWKNDRGTAMRGINPDTIVVPTGLASLAIEFAGAMMLSSTTNVWVPKIRNVICNPDLTDVNDWYAFCTTKPVKPFIVSRHKNYQVPKISARISTDSDTVFEEDVYSWRAKSRHNAGYGPWQLGVKISNSGSYTH